MIKKAGFISCYLFISINNVKIDKSSSSQTIDTTLEGICFFVSVFLAGFSLSILIFLKFWLYCSSFAAQEYLIL